MKITHFYITDGICYGEDSEAVQKITNLNQVLIIFWFLCSIFVVIVLWIFTQKIGKRWLVGHSRTQLWLWRFPWWIWLVYLFIDEIWNILSLFKFPQLFVYFLYRYPCQHERFIQQENGQWINNVTYCSGIYVFIYFLLMQFHEKYHN